MMITPFSLETKLKNTPVATAHLWYQLNLLAKPVKYHLSLKQGNKGRVKILVSSEPLFSLQVLQRKPLIALEGSQLFSFLSGPEKPDQFCYLLYWDCQPTPAERLLLARQLSAGGTRERKILLQKFHLYCFPCLLPSTKVVLFVLKNQLKSLAMKWALFWRKGKGWNM